MKRLMIFPLMMLLALACSKDEKKTSVKLRLGLEDAQGLYPGGMYLQAASASGQYMSLSLVDSEEVLDLANDSWSFKIWGWRESDKMTGELFCARVENQRLEGEDVTLVFNLRPCSEQETITLFHCNYQGEGEICPGGDTQGNSAIRSLKIQLHDVTDTGTSREDNPGLTSHCQNIAEGQGSLAILFNVPLSDSFEGHDLSSEIFVYDSTNCSGNEKRFHRGFDGEEGFNADYSPGALYVAWGEMTPGTGEEEEDYCDETNSSIALATTGAGTENDPWKVCSVTQLREIEDLSGHVEIKTDLDLTSFGDPFMSLDQLRINGEGHTLSNFSWGGQSARKAALIIETTNVHFENIDFENFEITNTSAGASNARTAGLVALAYNTTFSKINAQNFEIRVANEDPDNMGILGGLVGELQVNDSALEEQYSWSVTLTNDEDFLVASSTGEPATSTVQNHAEVTAGMVGFVNILTDKEVYLYDFKFDGDIYGGYITGGVLGKVQLGDGANLNLKYLAFNSEMSETDNSANIFIGKKSDGDGTGVGGLIGKVENNTSGKLKIEKSYAEPRMEFSVNALNAGGLIGQSEITTDIFDAMVIIRVREAPGMAVDFDNLGGLLGLAGGSNALGCTEKNIRVQYTRVNVDFLKTQDSGSFGSKVGGAFGELDCSEDILPYNGKGLVVTGNMILPRQWSVGGFVGLSKEGAFLKMAMADIDIMSQQNVGGVIGNYNGGEYHQIYIKTNMSSYFDGTPQGQKVGGFIGFSNTTMSINDLADIQIVGTIDDTNMDDKYGYAFGRANQAVTLNNIITTDFVEVDGTTLTFNGHSSVNVNTVINYASGPYDGSSLAFFAEALTYGDDNSDGFPDVSGNYFDPFVLDSCSDWENISYSEYLQGANHLLTQDLRGCSGDLFINEFYGSIRSVEGGDGSPMYGIEGMVPGRSLFGDVGSEHREAELLVDFYDLELEADLSENEGVCLVQEAVNLKIQTHITGTYTNSNISSPSSEPAGTMMGGIACIAKHLVVEDSVLDLNFNAENTTVAGGVVAQSTTEIGPKFIEVVNSDINIKSLHTNFMNDFNDLIFGGVLGHANTGAHLAFEANDIVYNPDNNPANLTIPAIDTHFDGGNPLYWGGLIGKTEGGVEFMNWHGDNKVDVRKLFSANITGSSGYWSFYGVMSGDSESNANTVDDHYPNILITKNEVTSGNAIIGGDAVAIPLAP